MNTCQDHSWQKFQKMESNLNQTAEKIAPSEQQEAMSSLTAGQRFPHAWSPPSQLALCLEHKRQIHFLHSYTHECILYPNSPLTHEVIAHGVQ